MSIYYEGAGVTLHHGDCIEVMRALPDASVDAVVTDPPYGLEFMGREWDGADGFRRSLNEADAGRESVFGRTSKRAPEYNTGRGVRVAEERASEMTPTGEGHSTSAGPYLAARVDSVRVAGIPFQEWCTAWASEALRVLKPGGHMLAFGGSRTWHRLTVAIEDAGFEIRDSIAWLYGSGFPKSMNVSKAIEATLTMGGSHTTMKRRAAMGSAYEPSAANGTFRKIASSMDNLRTTPPDFDPTTPEAKGREGWGTALKPAFEPVVVARKPLAGTVAKTVLEHGTGALNIDANRVPYRDEADRRESTDKNQHAKFGTEPGQNNVYGDYTTTTVKDYDSSKGRWPTNVVIDGSQSDALGNNGRIFPTFRYEAKAGSSERPNVNGVQHPTVKPLDLMRWLVRLVTPPSGTVLEPFAGSGTTLEAALLEGFNVIGIEREPDYLPLIEQRIKKPLQVAMFGDWDGDVA